jgi:protein SCO1/2
VAYSVERAAGNRPYEVTHSSAVFVFDRNGDLRLLFSGAATDEPDLDGLADDLRGLIGETSRPSLWQRILNLF